MSEPVTYVDMIVSEASERLDMDVLAKDLSMEMEVEAKPGGGVSDYNLLRNKPSINGTPLVGDYSEIDPTVPAWAKEPKKPTYNPDEIGALDSDNEMTYADIKAVWDSVFNR